MHRVLRDERKFGLTKSAGDGDDFLRGALLEERKERVDSENGAYDIDIVLMRVIRCVLLIEETRRILPCRGDPSPRGLRHR